MGKSANIYSLEVGTAIAKGGDQDANGLPAPGGVAFVGLPLVSGNIGALEGPQGFDDEDQGRATPGDNLRLPVGVMNSSGGPIYGAADGEIIPAQYPDSIAVSSRFCSFGGADPETFGLGKVLASGLGLHKPAIGGITTSGDGAADGSMVKLIEGDAAQLSVGDPIAIQGPTEIVTRYRVITSKAAPDAGEVEVTIHPKMPRMVLAGEQVQACYAYYPVVANANASNDVHLRMSAGGSGADASYGRQASLCRLSGFALSGENNRVAINATLQPAVVLPVAAPSVVGVAEPSGVVLTHGYGSLVEISDPHQGSSAPFAEGVAELSCFDWGVSVEVTVAPSSPDRKGVLRMQDMEIDQCRAELTLTTEPSDVLADMLRKSETRTVICSMGPHGPGHGGAFMLLNAGRLDGDASVGQQESRLSQTTTLTAVEGFAGNAGVGQLPEAPWMLVFPRT